MSEWEKRVRRVVHASTLGRVLDNLGESTVVSGTAAVGDTVSHLARQSFLFQWLTAEPDPEVIVIDLRETRTVGPIIRVLDWGITRIQPYWAETTLKRGVDGLVALSDQAADTRVGRRVARLLAPPESPNEAAREER